MKLRIASVIENTGLFIEHVIDFLGEYDEEIFFGLCVAAFAAILGAAITGSVVGALIGSVGSIVLLVAGLSVIAIHSWATDYMDAHRREEREAERRRS